MMSRILLFCFGGLMALSAGEPGQEGLALMQSLHTSAGRSDVVDRLKISSFCGPLKKNQIKQNWDRRGDWTKEGDYRFEVLKEKVDDDLAAVLIGARSPDNPFLAQVVPLTLVKGGEEWMVGPIEGSFENTGLGFSVELRERAQALENWLALERVDAISQLQSSEWQKFQESLEGAVPADELRELNAKDALSRFMTAVKAGDVKAAIAWQGFLERDDLPGVDWERNLSATRLGLKGNDKQNVWRLLTSPKVMRVIMDDVDEGDDNRREILVGFLSSYETGTMSDHINPVRFQMVETRNGWRIELPTFFAYADEEDNTFRNARNRAFNWQDRNGVQRMFGVFESEHEKIREEEARVVIEGLIKDLQHGDLETFLRRHYRFVEEKEEDGEDDDDDLELPQARFRIQRGGGDPDDEKRMQIYVEAVKWWDEALENHDQTEASLNKIYQEGDTVLAILSLPPSSDTWKPHLVKVWLGQEEDGWMILPGRETPLKQSYPESEEEAVTKLSKTFVEDKEKIYEDFLKEVLKVVALEAGEGEPASEEEALKLVREWREIARSSGMMELLKASALRQLPESSEKLLINLGYVRKEAAAAEVEDQILGTRSAGRYRGVSLMVDRGIGNERKCPLMIVVPVQDGYRILVDIELPLETNRGIGFNNLERMEELAKELSEEDLAHIKELREWHQKTARPVWEKWDAEKDADDD